MRSQGGKRVLAVFGVFALTFILAVSGLAQTSQEEQTQPQESKKESKSEHKMQEMVVTATRTEIDADTAPSSVTVITREDMELKNLRSVDDALKNEVGVTTARARGIADPASSSAVTMRGMAGQKRTLVLVDGIPVNDGYSNGVQWNNIPTDSVERIEIIRGPGSSLYGGNAMGGVINIITRVPQKTELMARGGLGTGWSNLPNTHTQFTTYRFGTSAGTRLADQVSVYGTLEGEGSNGFPTSLVVKNAYTKGSSTRIGGYPTTTSSGLPGWVVGDSGNNSGSRIAGNAGIAWSTSETGKLKADIVYGATAYDYGSPHTYTGWFNGQAFAGPGYHTDTINPGNYLAGQGDYRNLSLTLSYEEKITDKLKIKVAGSYQNANNWYTSPTSSSIYGYGLAPGTLSTNKLNTWFGYAQADYALFDGNTLTAGADLRFNDFKQLTQNMPFVRDLSLIGGDSDLSQGKSTNWALFAEDVWSLPFNLTLYTGLRFDNVNVFDGQSGNIGQVRDIKSSDWSQLSPRASLVWNPLRDTFFRVGVSNGFRAPNLYELYRSWTSYGATPTVYLANPNLKPETLWTYEAGVTQYFWDKRIKLGASLFHTDFNNYIDNVNVNGNSYLKQQQNVGKLSVNGFESQVEVKPWNIVTFRGNLAWYNPKIVRYSTYPLYEGYYLPGVPLVQANLGADLNWKWFKLSLDGNYRGRTYSNYFNNDPVNVYGGYTPRWVFDGKLIYSPTKYTDVSFSITNIMNQKYFQYYAGQPRTFMLELKVKF